MLLKLLKTFIYFIFISFLLSISRSEIVEKITISGNDRISNETIQMFSEVSINDDLKKFEVNSVLKRLYNTNYFENVTVSFNNNILEIYVKENPIIQNVSYNGIKANKIKDEVSKNLNLKSRSSFSKNLLEKDNEIIKDVLKKLGYYFPQIDVYIEQLSDNKINLEYNIDIGEKARIEKISFIGDKKFKDKKLKSVIITEEYKFWKFITGKKFLNESLIELDLRLLKNFYLNKGYYNVQIDSSFAKLIDSNSFELIFNINSNEKIYFDNLELNLPKDFNTSNFKDFKKLFKKLKGEPYSINRVKKILEEIDKITITEQYESITAQVDENIVNNKINLSFLIEQTDRTFVEKINIFGNNVTRENVIRNQFEIDEGDPFNEILANKSINNIKNLNFFRNVSSKIEEGSEPDLKVINITIEEKPTGEITAGAGVGTSGNTIAFGVRENNYLGKGISLDTM